MRIDRWAAVAALAAVMSQGCNDLTVRAVSRFAGWPVPGVQAQIDDGQWVETGANGRVTLSRPGKSFVLRVHQADPPFAFSERIDRFWVYVDPEDRELLLPVRSRAAGSRGTVAVIGGVEGWSGLPTTAYLARGVGSLTPMATASVGQSGGFAIEADVDHPLPYTTVIRVLELDSDNTSGRVLWHYRGYGELGVTLTSAISPSTGTGTHVSLKVQPMDEGMVTGTLTLPPSIPASPVSSLGGYLSFPAGFIELEPGSVAPDGTFTSFFPKVPTSEAWVYEMVGLPDLPTPGSLHTRRVAVPSTDVALDLPEPVALVEPADGATIGGDTVFRWTGGPPGGRATVLLSCSWAEAAENRSLEYRVESGGSELAMPALGDVQIAPGASCEWRVSWTQPGAHAVDWPGDSSADDYRESWSERRAATFQ